VTRPLFLVGCSAQKLPYRAPAGFLYTSVLFNKASAYAAARGDWLILSALHGVIDPSKPIDPYDRKMPTTRLARAAWARMVRGQMLPHLGRHIVALCGEDYLGWTSEFAGFRCGTTEPIYTNVFDVDKPLQGLGIGQRLQWLTRTELREAA
jgi:hypothetical protein